MPSAKISNSDLIPSVFTNRFKVDLGIHHFLLTIETNSSVVIKMLNENSHLTVRAVARQWSPASKVLPRLNSGKPEFWCSQNFCLIIIVRCESSTWVLVRPRRFTKTIGHEKIVIGSIRIRNENLFSSKNISSCPNSHSKIHCVVIFCIGVFNAVINHIKIRTKCTLFRVL